MPSSYTPSQTFKEGSEKEWPSKLGALDWDFTRIVFTKRTLIEFLRYTGTSVDPNLHNIAKLPRYADFGSLEEEGDAAVPGISRASHAETLASANDDFKPSRRVRTVPGGAQTFTLGDGSDEPFEIPSKNLEALSVSNEQIEGLSEAEKSEQTEEVPANPAFKPSRRVRTGPGGPSSMANLWDDHAEAEPFKPTRRVREGPGGADSISQIF
ncbi:hypothetical protein JB92DRAFT_2868614 [Gautieria morchelliformis]|nr:hypothetical protein JB92DRAFT_2868614 [Gautieria morchelliformis]